MLKRTIPEYDITDIVRMVKYLSENHQFYEYSNEYLDSFPQSTLSFAWLKILFNHIGWKQLYDDLFY